MLSIFEVSDILVSGILVSGKLQLPKLKLNPGLQVAQTEESEFEHLRQLLAAHFLIIRLITFWTGLGIPEIVELM